MGTEYVLTTIHKGIKTSVELKQIVNAASDMANEKSVLIGARIEDGKVTDLELFPKEQTSILGNIYLGKVKNIAPQLNAAFIEIADGIICYYPIDESTLPIITSRQASGTKKPLVAGDEVIVQVSKEAMKTKAPSVTGNLNFQGRYLVLTNAKKQLGVSAKIDETEKERLKDMLRPHMQEEFGLIARTNAAGISENELVSELASLRQDYETTIARAKTRTCFSLLYGNEAPYLSTMRQLPKETMEKIVTDVPEVYEHLQEILPVQMPEAVAKLQLFDKTGESLLAIYGIEKTFSEALKKNVWLKSGGSLVIEPTEALTVIDVNTGKFEGGKNKEKAFLRINREAVIEAARQIRLRNLSGIILIDLIEQADPADTEQVLGILKTELSKDPVKAVFVDMTKLQLAEITRKKIKKTLLQQWEEL